MVFIRHDSCSDFRIGRRESSDGVFYIENFPKIFFQNTVDKSPPLLYNGIVGRGQEPRGRRKTMTDLEQFMAECEALGRRADRKRGKDKKPRVNSVALKTPKSTDVVVPVDMTKEEIEAINAGIIMSTLGPDSLCWKCLNAHDNIRHSCEKFKTGRPVDGSTY